MRSRISRTCGGLTRAFIHGAGGIGQSYNCSCADAPGNKYFNPVLRHNGSFVRTEGYCTDLFFTGALGWIKEVKDSGKAVLRLHRHQRATRAVHRSAEEHGAIRVLGVRGQDRRVLPG